MAMGYFFSDMQWHLALCCDFQLQNISIHNVERRPESLIVGVISSYLVVSSFPITSQFVFLGCVLERYRAIL
jgi:hypothetical protein